jgi:hypothetical protein
VENIDINPQFAQVLEFINKTSQNVFLTGKAGTGKTTLLKYIRSHTYKQMAVCAPTGVAAINAGGSTIHSFFQFPFTPFLPVVRDNGEIDASSLSLPKLKYNNQRLSIFRNLELLVIDEISMVRADLLDQIDISLRQTRKKYHLPFGGVQLLLIGDMHQLPPVARAEEWRLLQEHYRSPYFFDSYVIRRFPPVYIGLTKVYRQSDQAFIDLLNKVRHNELDPEAHAILNARYRINLSRQEYSENITLTTHNRKADEINDSNLKALPAKLHTYKAVVRDLFPEKSYPAAELLQLKVGARVMFLKNNAEKNYYNGKIGIVTETGKDHITVKCQEDREVIRVSPEAWTNISYKVEKTTKHINEEVLGSFVQIPLRLAWAITIHKSQGLTFDKVIIDAAEAFSAGQVYVALSRCRSLEGLTLSSPIGKDSLRNDSQILDFAAGHPGEKELGRILSSARSGYTRTVIYDLFDFTAQGESRKELAALLVVYGTRLDGAAKKWLEELFARLDEIQGVDTRFRSQLHQLGEGSADPENDEVLQSRLTKAAFYFAGETAKLYDFIKNCPISVESREAANDLNETLQSLFESLFLKKELMASCLDGFRFEKYLAKKLKVEYPSTKINVYASAANTKVSIAIEHPVLYKELLALRDEICSGQNKPIYMVASTKTLVELARRLPCAPEELLTITGFGKARVEAYGDLFLPVINRYVRDNNLSPVFDFEAAPKKQRKEKQSSVGTEKGRQPNTLEKTMALFRQGFTPEQIARQRGLVVGTVLDHLVPFVSTGEIEIDQVVNGEKRILIDKALDEFKPGSGLGHLKSQLPENVSFAEIRFVQAYRERLTEPS